MSELLYIGLMSGTSLDALDAALISLKKSQLHLIATVHEPISSSLKERLLALTQAHAHEIDEMGALDKELGEKLAETVLRLLKKSGMKANQIRAIGSHGQTIRHRPQAHYPFTLQIGNPHVIAIKTGIQTVADFRTRDMVVGGQGAPLVPAFHHFLWQCATEDRWIINIGGIANLTYLPSDTHGTVIGFDSGPGNCLMDSWIQQHRHQPYDKGGQWAAEGKVHEKLLQQWLKDPYFSQKPPKSTGREYFHDSWIEHHLQPLGETLPPVDVQATLLELTAKTIVDSIHSKIYSTKAVIYVCGGGAYNTQLMKRIEALSGYPTLTTEKLGVDPQWVEACAFAWLAHQRLEEKPGNLPSVTGASCPVVLGTVYRPLLPLN